VKTCGIENPESDLVEQSGNRFTAGCITRLGVEIEAEQRRLQIEQRLALRDHASVVGRVVFAKPRFAEVK